MNNTNRTFSIIRLKKNDSFFYNLMRTETTMEFMDGILSYRDSDGYPLVSSNDIAVSIGTIPQSKLETVSKHLLTKQHEGMDIEKYLDTEKNHINLKGSLQNWLNTIITEKEFIVLEPAYNKLIDSYKSGEYDKGKLKTLFSKYVIMEHYFKIITNTANGAIASLNNDKEYVWFPKFQRNRNDIRKHIIDKDSVFLSDDMFVPYHDYVKVMKAKESREKNPRFLDEYVSMEKFFEILNKQKLSMEMKAHHFFNELLQEWFPSEWKRVKSRTLNRVPGMKRYAYIRVGNVDTKNGKILTKKRETNVYEYCDKYLNVLFSYNKTLFFYKPIHTLVQRVMDNNGIYNESMDSEMKNIISAHFDKVESFIKESQYTKEHLKKVNENEAFLKANIGFYGKYAQSIIESHKENNETYDADKVFAFMKKNTLESKLSYTVYMGNDLGSDKENKKQIKKIQESGLLGY